MKKTIILLLAAICCFVQAQTNELPMITVLGDRVSLRAGPDINSELLDRVMKDDQLVWLGETNGWFAVQLPDTIDLWVAEEYVEEGKVTTPRLNVRSGPNLNYSVVCVVSEGDRLTERDTYNGWIKIAPPAGSRAWISAEFAELVKPPQPEPEPAAEPMPEPEPEPVAVTVAPQPAEEELKPLVLVLDKSKKQGEYWEIPGVLRRANPGLYKLVLITEDTEETICLVRGQKDQMERNLNRAMLIKGKKYWALDVDLPIIQPVKIHLDPVIVP